MAISSLLDFFAPRQGLVAPAPQTPAAAAVAQPGVDESIPPTLTAKDLLREIVEDAVAACGHRACGPARIQPRDDVHMVAMIDLQGDAPDEEQLRRLDNMITLNAQALLGLSVTLYWRASGVGALNNRVDRAIQQELARLRKQPQAVAQ